MFCVNVSLSIIIINMICYYVSAVTWNSIFALGGGVNVKESGVELHEVLVQIEFAESLQKPLTEHCACFCS